MKGTGMKKSPEESAATPRGSAKVAEVAGPPSPEKLPFREMPATTLKTSTFPLPATVVKMPLAETFRIRLLEESAMKRFPEASTATPEGDSPDAAEDAP